MRKHQPDFDRVLEFTRSPKAFLRYMDEAGLDRAVLINAAAADVTGYPAGLNAQAAQYVKENPERLISCGSLHPRHSRNIMADIEEIVRLGLRLIKIHPPHQFFYPNDYLKGMKELELLYRAAESNGIPVMFHTGTSIFPGAPDLSLLAEMRAVARRHPGVRPEVVLALGTVRGASALGYPDVGSLEPGHWANLAVIALRDRDAADPHELILHEDGPVVRTCFRGTWADDRIALHYCP